MAMAVKELCKADILVQNIALGKQSPQDSSYLEIVEMVEKKWLLNSNSKHTKEMNEKQTSAVCKAMKSSFFLIQGPPGTGKTKVVAHIAQLFSKVNKKLQKRDRSKGFQVMCCGPSNKSVDVIAEYLLRNKDSLKLVRVYSEKKEQEEFPLPRRLLSIKKKLEFEDKVKDLKLTDISLHHMIRNQKHGIWAQYILKMDKRIKEMIKQDAENERSGKPFGHKDDVTEEELKEYRKKISEAEKTVLKQCDIILVTCSASGASRIKDECNIQQVIIDECGMCTEPESLIPIVLCKPKQVILVGDHQQLKPIVRENEASRRGLTCSLFQRYAEKKDEETTNMLTVQYRMHEAIAEFPSKEFYESELIVGDDHIQTLPSNLKFWPAGGRKPIVFVHLVGEEVTLSVATEEGGVRSKSNPKEIQYAVHIANNLVLKNNIVGGNIAILSQYRAQCSEIKKELEKKGGQFNNITVQTVVSAQGSEWDYVILSTARSLPEFLIDKKPTFDWKRKHLGFICDRHQINVALTRSKKGLIIIGNKFLLKCDKTWASLLKHYEANQACVDEDTFSNKLRCY